MPHLDFDTVLAKVGDYGRYQIVIYLLICIPASFPSAWTAFNQVLTGATPNHWCNIPELSELNLSPKLINCTLLPPAANNFPGLSQCFQYRLNYSDVLRRPEQYCNANLSNYERIPCQNGWSYDTTTYDATIVTEVAMVFYVGSFIGNILFGYIADRWGRRASFFLVLGIQVVFGTANAFATDIYWFTGLRFIVGLTFPASYQIPFVVGMELMGPSGRMFAGIIVCVIFGMAMCLLGIVSAYLRHWSKIVLISNAPFVVLFVYWWILPESPRWLVIMKRYDEAEKVLLRIAYWNNKGPFAPGELRRQCELLGRKSDLEVQTKTKDSCNIIDLVRTPNLRKKTIIITFVWLVNAVVYNGLTYNISNLGVNDYVSFAINGAVEVPAYFIIWPLCDRYGRRWVLAITQLMGGAACMCCMFVPEENPWVISGLAFFGKFGIAASFAIIYFFAGELYPTIVRAFGMGFSSMVAGSGLILAPYLIYLAVYARILPLLIMGVLTVAAGIASVFLPETLGAPLPQTIGEAEAFGKDFTFCHCPRMSTMYQNSIKSSRRSLQSFSEQTASKRNSLNVAKRPSLCSRSREVSNSTDLSPSLAMQQTEPLLSPPMTVDKNISSQPNERSHCNNNGILIQPT